MADSAIEWTQFTWNPTTGCDRVSPGCDHCYAMTLARRLKGMGQAKYQNDGDPRTSGPGFGLAVHADTLDAPLRLRKPTRIFVNSMSDLFHDLVPDEFIAQVFAVMAASPQHTYQLLTKRHARMRSLLNSRAFYRSVRVALRNEHGMSEVDAFGTVRFPLPNLWLGVSVEDQKWADIRLPALWVTPAAVRWLSCEPLLGPVDLNAAYYLSPSLGQPSRTSLQGIGWVVVGGESGHGARPMELDWARSIVQQCRASGVPVFVKQLGSRWGREHHNIDLFPEELQVREYPAERVAVPS